MVGNPPFGDEVAEGDEDHLGSNNLSHFFLAEGKDKVPSEHVILERSIELLDWGGRLGLVMPDGVINNQGEQSNCPRVRRFLAQKGFIEGIVSLPDYAFRKAGAQNKTSILFFRKFTESEQNEFDSLHNSYVDDGALQEDALLATLDAFDYKVFLAEANYVGYTTTGIHSNQNDLYRSDDIGILADDQGGTVLGEWRKFQANPEHYEGRIMPDCMAISISELWRAHPKS